MPPNLVDDQTLGIDPATPAAKNAALPPSRPQTTGIAWHRLARELGFGSGMTCWRRLRDWQQACVWQQLHEPLLAQLRHEKHAERSIRDGRRDASYWMFSRACTEKYREVSLFVGNATERPLPLSTA